MVPDTARDYLREIMRAIAALAELPERYKLVDEEPWHSRGVRKIIANNFFVYYRIDDAAKRVYIMNVIYRRRDQLRAMSRMRMN